MKRQYGFRNMYRNVICYYMTNYWSALILLRSKKK